MDKKDKPKEQTQEEFEAFVKKILVTPKSQKPKKTKKKQVLGRE